MGNKMRSAESSTGGLVAGNSFDKYHSRNPIHRALVGNFVRSAHDLIGAMRACRVLDIGCATGDLGARLLGPEFELAGGAYCGVDLCPDQIARARANYPGRTFVESDASRLPFADRSFDLVIACEVLEHVDRPADVVSELRRVCAGRALISVPWEPWWRVFNCLRGKYLARWGNTPGHVHHFRRRQIRSLVGSRFAVLAERRPLPWTMLLAA